jgi:hypothetical protein
MRLSLGIADQMAGEIRTPTIIAAFRRAWQLARHMIPSPDGRLRLHPKCYLGRPCHNG